MPIGRKANQAGVISPADLALLQKVYDRTAKAGEDDAAREARASRILANFLAGISDEDELVTLSRQPLSR